jgi:hypothetical protein
MQAKGHPAAAVLSKVRFGRKPGLGNRARLCLRNYMEAEALSVYGGFHIVDTIPVFLPGGFL